MPINQVVNQIILGTVTFSISFGIGLFANPDKALFHGAIAVLASSTGSMVANQRRIAQEKQHVGSLLHQIQEFEAEASQLYESVSQARGQQQLLLANINALEIERSQLLSRVSELHQKRNDLYQEFTNIQRQKQQQIDNIDKLKLEIQQIEKHQMELNQLLWSKTAQIQPAESRLNRLHQELDKLQSEIAQKLTQQQQLYQDLENLENRKQELGGEAYDLNTDIQTLKQRWEEINHSLLYLRIQQQQCQDSLTSLQAELAQMQSEVLAKQQQQEKLNKDLVDLENLKQKLESDYRHLQNKMISLQRERIVMNQAFFQEIKDNLSLSLPIEWLPWLEFTNKLNQNEQIALKAILERDEVAWQLICDEKSILPQILINSINHRALESFHDILLLNGKVSTLPDLNPEYNSLLLEPTTVYFKDLLNINRQNSSQSHPLMEEQKI